jgi:hypothetical protein
MKVACSSCGYVTDTSMVVAGCVKMHVTDQYICGQCIQTRSLACVRCGDSIWDFAVFIQQNPSEPVPAWYTSWKENGRNYM